MAFPLTPGADSAPKVVSVTPATVTPVKTGSVTRHWSTRVSGNSFGAAHRTVAKVTIVTPITLTPLTIGNPTHGAIRRWGGIGGTVLTPSFPQLAKNNTTFPSAI